MKRGFSLLELLILTFIGISILILIVGIISNSREFAKTMGCVNNMKNIVQAIENYQVDWKETPVTLTSLLPIYIENPKILHCPKDKESLESYSKFYIGRFFAEEDANKVFLICPRHFGGKRVVCGYLSYAVDVGKVKQIKYKKSDWSYEINAKPGEIYEGGILKFEDGTVVNSSNEIGIVCSFIGTEEKIYNIIFIPEGVNSTVSVEHQGNSRFEIITPAVIAGVEGTKFNITNQWTKNDDGIPVDITTISVEEGIVTVKERNQGRYEKVNEGEEIIVESRRYENPVKNKIPRKPPKIKPNIMKKKK
ncbi:MAG: FecR domain-containing protein [Candidatus Omnitrophica bacterium]|nr:FecR domain-containing protein [Candidatus Omnitrophota bacterium]MCM8807347.1 FecR domain-containing protein [Candidatus Omnitrophota bacterium]